MAWKGLEDHSQYRASEPRQRWLELVSPYFDGSPFMEHFELLVSGAEAPN